ncbi:S-layer homology domain-containing protein [Oscillospiraceae bacterium OttesenSCG-928-F05]|nr:S-layer homology domain-containing protein [Oscillospiraceae bacterium OttesenSCG-928-F05]
MQNLKKVFSLVLVFAMVLSLGLSAGAFEYNDKDEITNLEDFNLLYDLQIMQGDDKGNANPDGQLTRAQVVKMAYVAFTGGVDDKAVMFTGTSNQRFGDNYIGFWGEGYINYAASKGIVSGRGVDSFGVNKFDPNGTITGAEFLKIMLGMLGYDAVIHGLQDDPNWMMNAATIAKEIGILDGISLTLDQPILRKDAAAIMAKVIFTPVVTKYSSNNVPEKGDNFGQIYLSLVEATGVFIGNEHTGDAAIGKSIMLVDRHNSPSVRVVIPTIIDSMLYGQKVTAVLRLKQGKTALFDENNQFDESAILRVYGTPKATPNANIVTDLYKTSDFKKIGVSGDHKVANVGSTANSTQYLWNFGGVDATGFGNDLAKVQSLENGHMVRLVSNNGDKTYDYVLAFSYSFGEVKSATDSSINIGGKTYDAANAEGWDALDEGDFTLYFKQGDWSFFQKLEPVTAQMTSGTMASSTAVGKATIGGKAYESSFNLKNDDWNKLTNGLNGFYDTDLDFYFNGGTLIHYVGDSTTKSNNFLVITGAYVKQNPISSKVDLQVSVLTADDEAYGELTVTRLNGASVANKTVADLQSELRTAPDQISGATITIAPGTSGVNLNQLIGNVYRYTIDADAKTVTLSTEDQQAVNGGVAPALDLATYDKDSYVINKVAGAGGGRAFSLTADSVVFVSDSATNGTDATWSVYKGRGSVPKLTAQPGNGAFDTYYAGKNSTSVFALSLWNYKPSEARSTYAVLLKDHDRLFSNNAYYYDLTLMVADNVDSHNKVAVYRSVRDWEFTGGVENLKAGTIVKLSLNSSDAITSIEIVPMSATVNGYVDSKGSSDAYADIKMVKNTTGAVETIDTFISTKDSVFVRVAGKDGADTTRGVNDASDISYNDTARQDKGKYDTRIVLDTDGRIAALFQWDGNKDLSPVFALNKEDLIKINGVDLKTLSGNTLTIGNKAIGGSIEAVAPTGMTVETAKVTATGGTINTATTEQNIKGVPGAIAGFVNGGTIEVEVEIKETSSGVSCTYKFTIDVVGLDDVVKLGLTLDMANAAKIAIDDTATPPELATGDLLTTKSLIAYAPDGWTVNAATVTVTGGTLTLAGADISTAKAITNIADTNESVKFEVVLENTSDSTLKITVEVTAAIA